MPGVALRSGRSCTAVMMRSALMPLVMKVFDPLTT